MPPLTFLALAATLATVALSAAACSSGGSAGDGGSGGDAGADRTTQADAITVDGGGGGGGSNDARPDGGDAAGADARDAGADAPTYALPTAVAVPKASAPAPLPGGTRVSCYDGPTDVTQSDVCWVVKWGAWTYWPLTDVGNADLFYVTPFDAAGALPPGGLWPKVKAGARYPWRVAVDTFSMTVIIFGAGATNVTMTWDELRIDQPGGATDGGALDAAATDGGATDAAPYATPTVVQLSPLGVPVNRPAGSRAVCLMSATNTSPAPSCPVLRWGRWTYWVLDFGDNRDAFMIAPYDETGASAAQTGWPLEKTGGRYLWRIDVDASAMTVTLLGQATGSATATWAELRIDQP